VPVPDLPVLGASARASWSPYESEESLLFQLSEQKPNFHQAFGGRSMQTGCHLSPDGRVVAFPGFVGRYGLNLIVVWDLVNDQRLSLLPGRNLNLLAVAPAGRLLACSRYRPGVANADLVLLEPITGKEHAVFSEVGYSRGVRFSPDGSSLAAVSNRKDVRGCLRVWDVRSSQLLLAAENVGSFSFSPDGRHVIGSALDGSVYSALNAWDIGTPDQRAKSATLEKEVPIKHLTGTDHRSIANSKLVLVSELIIPERDGVSAWFDALFGLEEDTERGHKRRWKFVDIDSGSTSATIRVPDRWGAHAICPHGRTLALVPSLLGMTEIQLYDLPPRRTIELYVLLSTLPALLVLWLMWRRI
jgi:WD40 repeat protein